MHDRALGRRRHAALAVVLASLVAACATGSGPRASVDPTGAPTPAPTDAPGPTGTPSATDQASPSTGGGPTLTQPWAQVQLTNARHGSTFRVADFAGKTVFLEHMAIWCKNCKAQQREAAAALAQLGDDVVFIVLDVEPGEDAAALAAYAEQNGFPFLYAVAPLDYSRAISAEFGDLVLAPPTTPVWVIGKDGTVTFTPSGVKSADELIRLARQHGAS